MEQTMIRYEFKVLADIIHTLQPIKVRAEKLGSREEIFFTAEGVSAFVINELNEQNSPSSKLMKKSFIK